MKRTGNLYGDICDFKNLLRAARTAQKGKRFKAGCREFNLDLEKNLLTIQQELRDGTYRPGAYRHFRVHEPKERIISAVPYRDRVVHHALMNVIAPLFDRSMIYDSYANRDGKGTHRALDRFTAFSRKNRYVLKMDVKKYFENIDHAILMGMVERKIKDRDVLRLVGLIVASGCHPDGNAPLRYFSGDDLFTPLTRKRGLPIGNLTSQSFANVYLNAFDHYVKEHLNCRYYIRYMDDMAVFSDSKGYLREIRRAMIDKLSELRLRVHENRAQYWPVDCGTDWLGFRVYPTHRRVRKSGIKRCKKRLRHLSEAYRDGCVPLDRVTLSVRSWIAHASHADSYRLRERIMKEFVFQRG